MPAGREPAAGQREGGPAGSDGMVLYLKQMLKDLEQAQGGEDPEAAAALAELEKHTAALAVAVESSSSSTAAGSAPPEQDPLQLASEIDRLDDILSDLEAKLEGADAPTREILQNSAQIWLGKGQPAGQPPGEQPAEEDGPIRRPPASAPEGGGR